MNVILASQSPRRRELLGRLGVPFTVEIADIDETMDPRLPVADEVARLSRRKAAAVAKNAGGGDVIVAADTVVVLEDQVLGKPKDREDAVAMLKLLSGRPHQVMTGVTVRCGNWEESGTEITDVHFRPLSEREILAYADTGEPLDKAGAYGIQGLASVFVERLDGDYYNVMGLPLCRLCRMLRCAGVTVLAEP